MTHLRTEMSVPPLRVCRRAEGRGTAPRPSNRSLYTAEFDCDWEAGNPAAVSMPRARKYPEK